ncbi:hypothetical protein [Nocardiopsis sp. MG754419]|uniref:hypothetical protein n=1 Tax=Nocardiopsis sp. MG754419 TaxID=2259865 RepID=UPI001BAAB9C5|nr:hypothetical protein [Nocardiopsis sp. MG754419]MBR8743341.1 hypothetical protein [Nocardiopsis sp. MG754419]
MSGLTQGMVVTVGCVVLLSAALVPLWGPWVLVAALLLALSGGLVLLLSSPRAAVPGQTESAPDPFLESGPRSHRVKEAPLAGADEDYSFLFSAMVMWRWTETPDPRLHNPGGQAQQVIVEQARQAVARVRPEHCDVARHRIAADLGVAVYAYDGALEVWAEDVELTLSDDDMTRLERLSRLRKENVLWEVEKSVESAKRRYYADDVLATPGSAIVWDLVRGGVDVGRTHGLMETLARLAEASKGEDLADLLTRLRGAAPEEFAFLAEPDPDEVEFAPAGAGGVAEGHDPGRPAGFAAHAAEAEPPDAEHRARSLLAIVDHCDEDGRTQYVHRQVATLEAADRGDIAAALRALHPLPGDGVEPRDPEATWDPREDGNGAAPGPERADRFGHARAYPVGARNGNAAPGR